MTKKSTTKAPSQQQSVHLEDKIGERMREKRLELGLNFEELARLTAEYDPTKYKKGLTPAMLARYERGVNGRPVLPGARELRILCHALNVKADWLLLGAAGISNAEQAKIVANTLADLLSAVQQFSVVEGTGAGQGSLERAEKMRRAKNPVGR